MNSFFMKDDSSDMHKSNQAESPGLFIPVTGNINPGSKMIIAELILNSGMLFIDNTGVTHLYFCISDRSCGKSSHPEIMLAPGESIKLEAGSNGIRGQTIITCHNNDLSENGSYYLSWLHND